MQNLKLSQCQIVIISLHITQMQNSYTFLIQRGILISYFNDVITVLHKQKTCQPSNIYFITTRGFPFLSNTF